MQDAPSQRSDDRMVARGLAAVLVAAADRRLLPALALVPQLAGSDSRAVHIALDGESGYRLARDWMDLGIGLPLQIEEPAAGTSLAEAVRAVIEREVASRPQVTVIVPEMDLGRWWQPLLHRGAGRAVAWALHDLPHVTTLVLPVRTEVPSR